MLGSPRAALAGVGSVLSPRGLRGVAVESIWLGAHAALYPLGILNERSAAEAERWSLERLGPVQRGLLVGDLAAAGTPILLVHGMIDNRSVFTVLRRSLRRKGFGVVTSMNYSVLTSDVRSVARTLAARVEALCRQTGYDQVHVIGHSLGGLIARYYVQHLGGDQRVHTLVTLGSPHEGTSMARVLPGGLAHHLRPTSAFIGELQAPAPGCRTRFVAVWSDLDEMMLPRTAARLQHPDLTTRNVAVRGVGHMSLPMDRQVCHEVAATLSNLAAVGAPSTGARSTAAPSTSAGSRTGSRGRTG